MKNIILLLVFFSLPLYMFCSSNNIEDEEKIVLKATEYYDNKEYEKALNIINRGVKHNGLTDKLIHTKYKILLASEKYEQALTTFELIIGRVGDSPDVVIDKIRLLMKLKRYDDALETALSVDAKSQESSPYISLAITRIFLAQQEVEQALTWLEKSFKRGFYSYDYLFTDEFIPLHRENKFASLIEQMKEKAGIGLPAKDFSIVRLSGETYQLSQDKGKVIILDFWATWCPPCVAEYPNLVELYNRYQNQGLEIIGICADSKREALENFIGRNEIPWVNGYSGKGRKDPVVSLYNIDSFPNYIIIDRKGIVQYSSSAGGAKLENLVMKLISE